MTVEAIKSSPERLRTLDLGGAKLPVPARVLRTNFTEPRDVFLNQMRTARPDLSPDGVHLARLTAAERLSAAQTSTRALIGSIQKLGAIREDVSKLLLKNIQLAVDGQLGPMSELKNVTALFVGGLFSGWSPTALYLGENIKGCEDLGVPGARVPVDTDGSPSSGFNTQVIQSALQEQLAAGKKVIIFGHSNGGCDILRSTWRFPELDDPRVTGVFFQSPIGGSPMADDIIKIPGVQRIAGGILKDFFGGDPQSAVSIEIENAMAELVKNGFPKQMKMFSVCSTRDDLGSSLYALEEYMRNAYGDVTLGTDGLVAAADTRVPGAYWACIPGIDHIDGTVTKPDLFLPYGPREIIAGTIKTMVDLGLI